MVERLKQLASWGLPPTLLRLASDDLPHPAFAAACKPLRAAKREPLWGLQLDSVHVRPDISEHPSAALWEHDIGDGHAFEVVYCARTPSGVEFWHVTYADDMPAPTSHLVSRSEQGLYYWLFFYLIQSEFFVHGEHAYNTLAAAAKTVGFQHLVEVFRLEQEIGSDYARQRELRERALGIA